MRIILFSAASVSIARFRLRFIHALVSAGNLVTVISPEDDPEHAEAIRGAGAKFIPFSLQRTGANPLAELRVLIRLRNLWRTVEFDHLVCYAHKPALYGLMTAPAGKKRIWCMLPGLGFVYTGDTAKHRVARFVFRAAYRVLLRRAAALFLLNSDDERTLRQAGVVTDRNKVIVLNGEGVPLDEFPPSPVEMGVVRFLMIARLLRDKGISEYLEAAALVKARHPHVEFALVGPLDSHPTALSAPELHEFESRGIVKYHGAQKDVRPYLNSCTVYVLPSYREGTPRTVLEAMATGRAIITTDVPGCRSTIHETTAAESNGMRRGINGWLVPVRNATALAAAMEQFVLHPNLAAEMGKCGRRLVEREYDVDHVNRAIMSSMLLPPLALSTNPRRH